MAIMYANHWILFCSVNHWWIHYHPWFLLQLYFMFLSSNQRKTVIRTRTANRDSARLPTQLRSIQFRPPFPLAYVHGISPRFFFSRAANLGWSVGIKQHARQAGKPDLVKPDPVTWTRNRVKSIHPFSFHSTTLPCWVFSFPLLPAAAAAGGGYWLAFLACLVHATLFHSMGESFMHEIVNEVNLQNIFRDECNFSRWI